MRKTILVTSLFAAASCWGAVVAAQQPSGPPSAAPPVDARPINSHTQTVSDQVRPIGYSGNAGGTVEVPAILAGAQEDGDDAVRTADRSAAPDALDQPNEPNNQGFLAPPIRTPAQLGLPTQHAPTAPARSGDEMFLASSESTMRHTGAMESTIETIGPSIRVLAQGPASIAVGKSARYVITAANTGNTAASELVVVLEIPQWLEVTSTAVTSGSRDSGNPETPGAIRWTISKLAPGASDQMTLDMIPRQARGFDFNLQWTLMPVRGATAIQVTEPRLEIHIAGPDEVQFGEKALYHVTVNNPGTGVAEGVTVMLPEALGGERASLGDLEPGQSKEFQVELIARQAGQLDLTTTVTAGGNLRQSDTRAITVRRAALVMEMNGPRSRYAGSTATYSVTVANTGDAVARDVVAAISLPAGIQYQSGIDGVEQIDGGLRWSIGSLPPGGDRTFELQCVLSSPGDAQIEAGARGAGDLAATAAFETSVKAIADLVLAVDDPQGPLMVGENATYQIRIRNRGTRSAQAVQLVMQFSDGIEPTAAEGWAHQIVPGQVMFDPIAKIEPGQEIVIKVTATANASGTMMFRAQLDCEESSEREVAEGTTRYVADDADAGDSVSAATDQAPSSPPAEALDNSGAFKR